MCSHNWNCQSLNVQSGDQGRDCVSGWRVKVDVLTQRPTYFVVLNKHNVLHTNISAIFRCLFIPNKTDLWLHDWYFISQILRAKWTPITLHIVDPVDPRQIVNKMIFVAWSSFSLFVAESLFIDLCNFHSLFILHLSNINANIVCLWGETKNALYYYYNKNILRFVSVSM